MLSKKRTLSDSDDSKTPPRKKQKKSSDSQDTASDNLQMKELLKKYNAKKQENMTLKENLLSKILGVSDDSTFPNIEEFVKLYKIFINQTHNNLLNDMIDILEEIMEEDEDLNEEEEDNDDDDDVDIEQENNIPDIESIIYQKICYEILYNIIIKCYERIQKRKNIFYEIISKLLHATNNNEFKQKMSMFIDIYLQNKWDTFIQNKYYKYENKNNDDDKKDVMNEKMDNTLINNFDHRSIDKIIDNIYDEIKVEFMVNKDNKCNLFLKMFKKRKSKDIHVFIGQCCVIFWILILNKQQILELTHNSFWIKDTGKKFIKIHHSIDYDLKYDKKELIKYCGIPGVTVRSSHKKNEPHVVLIEPHVFIHDNKGVINELHSDLNDKKN